jgi:hypothetical protein
VAQPWHELASVYDRNGQPADARWLRREAARGVTRTSRSGPKLVRWIYGALTGHGYYRLRAAFWLVLAVLVTISIVATHRADFAPTAMYRPVNLPNQSPAQHPAINSKTQQPASTPCCGRSTTSCQEPSLPGRRRYGLQTPPKAGTNGCPTPSAHSNSLAGYSSHSSSPVSLASCGRLDVSNPARSSDQARRSQTFVRYTPSSPPRISSFTAPFTALQCGTPPSAAPRRIH